MSSPIQRTIETLKAGTALPELPKRTQRVLAMVLALYDGARITGREQAFLDYLAAWAAHELRAHQSHNTPPPH